MLTQGQIDHYEAFGFLVLRGLLSQDEMDELRAASLSVMRELRGDDEFQADENQSVQPWLERHPAMRDLIDDERIHQIPESLLGPDFWLDGTEGHLRVGDTPWHGDDIHDDDLGWVKIAIYLDPLTKHDGCLRVIPGTHRRNDPDPLSELRSGEPCSRRKRVFGMPSGRYPLDGLGDGTGRRAGIHRGRHPWSVWGRRRQAPDMRQLRGKPEERAPPESDNGFLRQQHMVAPSDADLRG